MKCLDTDFLVAVLRGNRAAGKKADELDEEGGAATTVINAYEILFGARRSSNVRKSVSESAKLLAKLTILDMNINGAAKAAEIHAGLYRKGKTIDVRDVFIASISLSSNATLLTRNTKHFSRIKELKTEKW